MSHIFISYSKQNIDFVRYLRALLENEGFAVWVDEERLAPSAKWWKAIEQNVEACGVFIVVMSPDAAESDWVEREILLAEKLKRPIYPILLAGAPWSRLANIQYEDMRAGLRAKFSPHFLNGLRGKLGTLIKDRHIAFTIEFGDITSVEADVAAFKHANGFHGADRVVADRLYNQGGITFDLMEAKQGEYRFIDTGGIIAAPHALFVGTPGIRNLRYKQIREFASRVLSSLAEVAPQTRYLAMTTHGPSFSLDEAESILSQFAGFRDAMQAGTLPPALQRITIVEIDKERVGRLQAALEIAMNEADYAVPFSDGWGYQLNITGTGGSAPAEPEAIQSAGTKNTKPHAYVAMPYSPELSDLFVYGIQSPIHARGLLCEYVNQESLTHDMLDQIKARIVAAAVVVADLTGADPGVYLQVGYAWGKARPTLLLAKEGEPVLFETAHPPLTYRRIKDLEAALAEQLDSLRIEGLL
jgi:hypothetical protein